jgi:hypothetical protein
MANGIPSSPTNISTTSRSGILSLVGKLSSNRSDHRVESTKRPPELVKVERERKYTEEETLPRRPGLQRRSPRNQGMCKTKINGKENVFK